MTQAREKAIIQCLLRWYGIHYRRDLPWRRKPRTSLTKPPNAYHIWLAEIMAQQTTVQAAKAYYQRFLERWPNVQALAKASEDEVLAAWAGLGYYRRARNLLLCAREICAQYQGVFPKDYDQLLALPGIGPYSAAAICAVAFNQRIAPLDTHIQRVTARLYGHIQPDKHLRADAMKLFGALARQQHAGDLTQALMDLGAQLCIWHNPRCTACPLAEHCRACQTNRVGQYPRPPRKATRPTRYGVVYWLERADGKLLLRRRPSTGLLGGMLEFPSTAWLPHRARARMNIVGWPHARAWRIHPMPIRHVFTHFALELQLRIHRNILHSPLPHAKNLVWLAPNELEHAALPSLMRKVIRAQAKA